MGVECLLVAAAAAVTLGLAAWLGRSWWLAGAPLFVLGGVLYFIAQPLVIQPLFNSFHPLGDQRLAAEIKALGAKEGVTVDKVSSRTRAGGRRPRTRTSPGSGRRSVSSSTTRCWTAASPARSSSPSPLTSSAMLRRATSGGARLVRPDRDPRRLPRLVVHRAARRPTGSPARAARDRGGARLLASRLSVRELVSRRYEAEADWMALTATNDPESFIGLEKQLTATSLGDPDPPAWSNLLSGHIPPR